MTDKNTGQNITNTIGSVDSEDVGDPLVLFLIAMQCGDSEECNEIKIQNSLFTMK